MKSNFTEKSQHLFKTISQNWQYCVRSSVMAVLNIADRRWNLGLPLYSIRLKVDSGICSFRNTHTILSFPMHCVTDMYRVLSPSYILYPPGSMTFRLCWINCSNCCLYYKSFTQCFIEMKLYYPKQNGSGGGGDRTRIT